MKNKNKKPRFLALRPGAILYGFLLVICLVFTQALRSPASAILFVFLLFVPLLSFIYIAVARAGIKVYTECDNTRAEKGQTVGYEIRIINETPLPFPFVETIVTLPSDNAVVCLDKLMRITLLPMGCHDIVSNVSFPLRGSYDIGVKYLYVNDLFGLFRTEMKLELHRTVIVYPRSIVMAEDSGRSDTDIPTPVTKRTASPEQAEPADIRDYIPGDSMKNIHWKLSSKSEELQVKNFASNTDKHTYILCDLTFGGDGVTESEEKAKDGKKQKRSKKMFRRSKTGSSAGVASAKSVGNAGGDDTPKFDMRNPEERLAALGVTPEKLAAIGSFDVSDEVSVMDAATRKGSQNIQKLKAERFAKLAIAIDNEALAGEGEEKKSPFNEENLSFAGELASDSVIELALSAMRYEVSKGVDCTVLYPDARSDNGFGILSSTNDIPEDPSLIQFFTAPVCRDRSEFAKLAMMIEQSAGMTIRMVSANTDLYSSSVFSAIPAAFGGAGAGCSAEVMLSDPDNLWASTSAQSISAQALSSELSRSGVRMRQFTKENGNDGALRFTSVI